MRSPSVCAAAAVVILALAGCGSSSPKTACDLVSTSAVATQARQLVGASVGSVTATPEETSGLSVCRFDARDLSVRVSIDTNAHAPRRFFNRLDEQWEFYAGSEDRKPVLVSGVGDDRTAFGGAGAYWIAANHQLIVLSRGRLIVVTVGGGKAARALASAKRLARMITRSDGSAGESPRELATASDTVEVFEPLNGVLIRASEVTVHGAVAPADAQVRVDGHRVRLRPGGFFSHTVALSRGENRIRVTAARDGRTFDALRISVRRGASPAEEAAAVARRFDGRLPDLRTQRLDVVLAILARLGLRHTEATVQPGRVVPSRWTVCSSKPAKGTRVHRGRRILLFVAPGRLDKPSTTDCVSD